MGELKGSEDSFVGFGEMAETYCGWQRFEDPGDDWKIADSTTSSRFQY